MECQSGKVIFGSARVSLFSLPLLHHCDDPGRLLHGEVAAVAVGGRPPLSLVHLLQHVDDLVEGDREILHGAGLN